MYCINPEDDEPIFCLFDPIGRNESKPLEPFIDGNQFARELLYLDGEGKKRIQIWINSEGGSVKDGLSICAAMLKTKTKIDTLVIGIAYSMAGVIALMGRKVEMMDFSSLMLHEARNPESETEDKDGLDLVNTMLATAISGRSGKKIEEVAKIMKAETFYSAIEAKEAGLIDAVVNCGESNVPRSMSDSKAKIAFGKQYVNKILPQNKNDMDKKAICALLGLDENVSDAVAFAKLAEFKAIAEAKKKEENDDMEDEVDGNGKKTGKRVAKKKNVVENADEDKTKMKANAKLSIEAKAKAVGITLEEKEVNDFVALSGSPEGLAIVLTQVEAKATAKIDLKKAENKGKIEKLINDRGLKLEQKAIDNYVALAGSDDTALANVTGIIEAIPTGKKSPEIKALNKEKTDSLGIALIETAGTDTNGNPIAKDTSKMVDSINSFDFKKLK